MPSCIRAPPLAENRGSRARARREAGSSNAKVTFSPTTLPIEATQETRTRMRPPSTRATLRACPLHEDERVALVNLALALPSIRSGISVCYRQSRADRPRRAPYRVRSISAVVEQLRSVGRGPTSENDARTARTRIAGRRPRLWPTRTPRTHRTDAKRPMGTDTFSSLRTPGAAIRLNQVTGGSSETGLQKSTEKPRRKRRTTNDGSIERHAVYGCFSTQPTACSPVCDFCDGRSFGCGGMLGRKRH